MAITVTNELCKKYNVTTGKCTLGVDNKGALATTFGWRRPNPRWASYDLVGMIRYHKAKSPISWAGKHVKGHQDDNADLQDLDEWALGNIAVDKEADMEMNRFREAEPGPMMEGESWRLRMDDTPIAGNIERTLKHRLGLKSMPTRWKTLLNLSDDQWRTIDWEVFTKTHDILPDWKNIWMTKHNARLGPVMTNMVRRRHATDEGCPNCGMREDTDHIFTCRSTVSEAIFRRQKEILKLHLQDTTSKQMQLIIMELVISFHEAREPNKNKS